MLTTKEKTQMAFNTSKGIFKDALINNIADLTDENLNSVTDIITNLNFKLEDPALFMSIADQGLILADTNLTSIKTIFQIIDKKTTNSIQNKANFYKMTTIINHIHNNGKIFRNIIHKYLKDNENYKDQQSVFSVHKKILTEHDKNIFITKRWNQISSILNKVSSIAYTDIKLLISSTSKILQRITTFIEMIKEGIEQITTHIKTCIEKKMKGEKLKFIEITSYLTQQILERSNIYVLTQVIKLNRQPYYLLN